MITVANRRLWLCGEPVDVLKGIHGMISVVQQRLLCEVLTGDVFLFVDRNASRLKILCLDRDGDWLATTSEPGTVPCSAGEWQ
jgi:transposase